jgi:hypothetical protein
MTALPSSLDQTTDCSVAHSSSLVCNGDNSTAHDDIDRDGGENEAVYNLADDCPAPREGALPNLIPFNDNSSIILPFYHSLIYTFAHVV